MKVKKFTGAACSYTNDGMKRTPYVIAGKRDNHGGFCEVEGRFCLTGKETPKDGNTAWNEGSDIPELGMSLKSDKGSLCNTFLGVTQEEILNAYFRKVASTSWGWVMVDENTDTVTVWVMNKAEFEEFCLKFTSYEKYRKKLRFRTTSVEMLRWFESKMVG